MPRRVRLVLERAERFEFFSVNPGLRVISKAQDAAPIHGELLLGHEVMGKAVISDSGVRRRLLRALYSGVAYSHNVGMCFMPRHGIRASYKGETGELLICFQCLNIRGSFGDQELSGSISRAPEKLFNRILADAHVPLSKN
jgi:hypothetical protein